MALFDVHAHLTHPRLLPHIAKVLASARAVGVTTIVSNGLNPEDNAAVAALAAAHPNLVRPAFGLYPVDAVLPELLALGHDYPRPASSGTAEEAVQWVEDHVDDAVAVGEIGLDGHWVPEPLWERQEQIFRALVSVALRADKPIIIHTRKREQRVFDVLAEMGARRVNWHCFGGRVKLARRAAIELGHHFSIPANAPRSQSFTRMLETLPPDKVLLETDCPYLAPEPNTTNEPKNVAGTAAYAATLWGLSQQATEQRLCANFEALFGFAP